MNKFNKLYERVMCIHSENITESHLRDVSIIFDYDENEKLYNFLYKIVKSNNGFVGDNITEMRNLLNVGENTPMLEEFTQHKTITFDTNVMFSVPVGDGNGYASKSGRRLTVYQFNSGGDRILKVIRKTPSNMRGKIVFEADPNFVLADISSIKDQHDVGDNFVSKLTITNIGTTKYQKRYFKFVDDKNSEYITFKPLPTIPPLKKSLEVGDALIANINILKKDMYNNKINYVINILKVNDVVTVKKPEPPKTLADNVKYEEYVRKVGRMIRASFPEDHLRTVLLDAFFDKFDVDNPSVEQFRKISNITLNIDQFIQMSQNMPDEDRMKSLILAIVNI